MKINRDEARQHLQAGRPVAFRTPDGQGRTLTPQFGRRAVQALPPEDVEGSYYLLRDEHGNLTRAGMEQAIREGGSVMHPGLPAGEVIESIDDLPDEVDLVKGNERARRALAESLDAQLAILSAQRARLDAPAKPDEETPAVKQAKQSQQDRAAEEEKTRRQREQGQSDVRPEHERDRQREEMMATALSPQHEQAMLADAAAEETEEAGEQEQASTQQAAERRTQAQQQRRERERREREAQQQEREGQE